MGMKRSVATVFGFAPALLSLGLGCSGASSDSDFVPPATNDASAPDVSADTASNTGGHAGAAGQGGSSGQAGSGVDASAGGAAGVAGSPQGGAAGAPASGGNGGEADAGTDSAPDVDFGYDAPNTDAAAEACASSKVEASLQPLDMYFMIDRSGSMKGNPWIQQGLALSEFFSAQGSTGISVALQYFPLKDDFTAMDLQCSGQAYVSPFVDWGVLPAHAAALDAAYATIVPAGNTPTQEALNGVLKGARARQLLLPDHVVVAVMVSDGAPCCNGTCPVEDATGIGQIAASFFNGQPSVRTFAIYVAADASDVMTQIAVQGGTTQAYNATGGNLALLNALKAIQGTAIPCEFPMPQPDAGIVNPDQVTMEYVSGGASSPVPRVDNANLCGPNGGWFYDVNADPSKLLLCPATCSTMKADPNAKVSISLGCLGS